MTEVKSRTREFAGERCVRDGGARQRVLRRRAVVRTSVVRPDAAAHVFRVA